MSALLRKSLILLASFTAISLLSLIPTTGVAYADYNEECNREGCSREEVEELWESFNEECFGEGCWREEASELAGGTAYIEEMYESFRSRLGKSFSTPRYNTHDRPTFWDYLGRFCDWIGGCNVSIGCTYDAYFMNWNCGPGSP